MVKKAAEAKPNHLLRAARLERNWTQQDVADRIGSPQSFNVSRWEKGTAFPSSHYIQQLCLLFGKSAQELGLSVAEPGESSQSSAKVDALSLWNVPYRRNPLFTGRKRVLRQLHDRLMTSQSAALTQTQAISGLGGIGKTQIAVEYAYRHREFYQAIFWVRAASPGALISDYVTLATLLGLPEQNEQDQKIVVAAVKRWLAYRKGWLLILDNADDLDLVVDFLPTGNNGHILLTTRTQATGGIAPSIAVEKMEQSEGVLLLLCRAKLLAPGDPMELVSQQEQSQATAIVEAMDGLPLALDQAGAYIEETGCGLAGYLELYRSHRKELLRQRGTLHLDHPEPVASTWALSFSRVEQANPAAADLLRLCAFLDPDAIPEEIIIDGATTLGPILGPVAAHPFQLNEVIQELRRYSLVKRVPEAKLLNIHRLVQVVLKDEMDKQTRQQWAERTVRVLNSVFPEGTFENWQRCQQYLPQAQVCVELIEQYHFSFPEAARLLMQMGSYLRERALPAQAEPLLEHALAMREQVLGPEHPDTASTLNILARLYGEQSRYAQAESLFQRALTIRERVLGSEHPDTAFTLDNLAWLYHEQGRYAQAEPLYQRALAIRERVLGPEHRETATTLDNLAWLYHRQGRYAQAEPLYERVLAIREQVLGPENPYTAYTINHLALLHFEQGRYEQAEILYERSLAIFEQVLGPEHPYTGMPINNLALLYLHQARYEQAEQFSRRALAIFEQVLGSQHPGIANPLLILGSLYRVQGRYEQAEPLYQRVLAIEERALDPEDPRIVATLDNLGSLYRDQGYYEQAEPLFQRALLINEKVFGLDHLDTAESLYTLADLYRVQDKAGQARPLYQRVLAIREKALGPEHPDTIKARESYASLQEAIESSAEIAKMNSPQ